MRTTIISTSKIKTYKIISISIVSVITLLVVGGALYSSIGFGENCLLLIVPIYIMFAYKGIPAIVKIKNVSYDDSSVYYDKKDFEVQIPFEDIRDIELKTISGIYKINLYAPSQDDGTYVVEAKPKFKQLAVNTFKDDPSRVNASVVPSNNQLIMRTDKAIYCIAEK